jgi:hypothetical protein
VASKLLATCCSSETSVGFYWTAWHYTPEGSILHKDLLFGKLSDTRLCVVCTDVDNEDVEPNAESSDQFKSNAANRCSMSQQERAWREVAYDYEIRFCGHCNTTTDIKEANFFGR